MYKQMIAETAKRSLAGEVEVLTPGGIRGKSGGLPPGGQWKCFDISGMSEVELREGRWHSGRSHSQPQYCVADVELDVNPDSPYVPRPPIGNNGRPSR